MLPIVRSRTVACGWLFSVILAPVIAVAGEGFSHAQVVAKAQQLAASAYRPPESVPDFMTTLAFHDYQGIRFRPERSLLRDRKKSFQVMMFPTGLFYRHKVRVNLVDAGLVRSLEYDKSMFEFADPDLERRVPEDAGFAGFKLTYPIVSPGVQDQFMVFAGASYFRGVGRDNAWGLSARGVAIDTGLPKGEEFPSFTEFWLETPADKAETLVVHGLLEGESLAGAYRFEITPGTSTQVLVQATLFPRQGIELPGIAPLTSMFYYGENTIRPHGEWRGRVHDSDGLLVHDRQSGERLWRPLLNPINLESDYFSVAQLGGFGLLQRTRDYHAYLDSGAHYEQRPSAWIEPVGNWGAGQVVLIQLPTADETNDNIVAFWKPELALEPGKGRTFEYRLAFGTSIPSGFELATTLRTLVGDGNRIGGGERAGAYRVIVDFKGGRLDQLADGETPLAEVTPLNATSLHEHFLQYIPAEKAWRLSMLATPAVDQSLELRAFLRDKKGALSETWTYRLPADNSLVRGDR